MSIAGTAGLSIGIVHGSQPIYTTHFGYRDVEKQLAPDGDTVYHIGSMTKGMVVQALAFLVDEGSSTGPRNSTR